MRIPVLSDSLPFITRPRLAALVVAVSLVACISNDPSSPTIPGSLLRLSGDTQTVTHNSALAKPMVVRVLAQDGTPLSGITVYWALATADSGTLVDTTSTSNSAGDASMSFTAGSLADTVQISAILITLTITQI